MAKKSCLILSLLIFVGCGSSLKKSWNNFTAYYNTFYNAKNDFEAGLKKVEEQPVQINPDELIRLHRVPLNVGQQNFEEAITKGALILRRHSESKWTNNAVLLIGKSYYYLQQYFLAIQTFEDLLNTASSIAIKQEAILWKGRTLLEISSFGEGISFLEEQLENFGESWEPQKKAEARIILAQHFAMLQSWEQAAGLLEPSILGLDDRSFKGRSYFLLGQILQQQGDYNRAYQAYSNVARNFPDYEYIYWAGIKRAETARLNDNLDLAISIYRTMLNDDKNFDRTNELNFQLAETYEQIGNNEQAEAIYKQLLNNSSASVAGDLKADIYFGLGQLYSREYNDYELAAAYFDSSSLSDTRQIQELEEDAAGLASAYGKYISLKNGISKVDSLLALGELNQQQLDSVLVRVRRKNEAELNRNQNLLARETNNTLVNLNQDTGTGLESPDGTASSFGFLSYRDARSVENAKQQFQAIWGARPLVDNWRRISAVRSANNSNQGDVAETPGITTGPHDGPTDRDLGIYVDEIPFSEAAKRQKKQERINLQYRLGNLFFLTLNQPDSAAAYFKKVLKDSSSTELVPKTLFSLYKLYDLEQQADSSLGYKNQIIAEYPASIYADRIRLEEGGETSSAPQNSSALLRKKVQTIVNEQDSVLSASDKAEKLRELSLENRSSPLASDIFYQAIQIHIQYAKDLAFTEPDTTGAYSGKGWDKVRSWLTDFKQNFPNASQIQSINAWSEVINNTAENEILSCAELGVTPSVQPDMQTFLNTVQLPEKVKGLSLSGRLTYRLTIGEDGTVESYNLLSNRTDLGIEEAYEMAIEQSLVFKPITQNGAAVKVSCEVEFPIKQ